jgi:hypothetical protein
MSKRKITIVFIIAITGILQITLVLFFFGIPGLMVFSWLFPNKFDETEICSPTGPQKAWKADWCCFDGPCDRIFFFDGKKKIELESLEPDWDWLDGMLFTGDGKFLVVLITSSELLVYDGKTGEEITGRFSLSPNSKSYPPQPQWRFYALSEDTLIVAKVTPRNYYFELRKKSDPSGKIPTRRFILPNLREI